VADDTPSASDGTAAGADPAPQPPARSARSPQFSGPAVPGSTEPAVPGSTEPAVPGSTDRVDALESIRAQLAAIDDLPLEERVARFEQINASIAAQLAELDEL
jgi:hypothetical protein